MPQKSSINNIPYVLAATAHVISSIGYKTTEAIEKVMHVLDDLAYNKTGHIFGSDPILDANKYLVTDEDVAKNLRVFVQKCIILDLEMGRYKMDELYKADDLLTTTVISNPFKGLME